MGIKEETIEDTLDSIVSEQMGEGLEEDPEIAAEELMRKILDEAGVITGQSVISCFIFFSFNLCLLRL